MKIRFGNVTVDTDTDSLSDIQQAAQDAGGAVNGGHFGGQNHGITGGVFHGNVHIDRDDD
ncbi:hypothetical protein [Streptomyces sp. SID9124]|uniref:hypothetical protein n=1 Tax=Streptomyces sp. SID9124 TaxID=2706108 RepID=UPI0013E01B2E|nr:hypothetical protein [Streptomyces sp. SID9124]NED12073.1 hypothetical protein [Streptomyces sp. SID9124]